MKNKALCTLLCLILMINLMVQPIAASDTTDTNTIKPFSTIEYEYNDEFGVANLIETGTTYVGNLISKNDVDYYKFILDSPGNIVINYKNEPNLSYDCKGQIVRLC